MTVVTSGAAGNLREQILSAAASCFRERGIKATKMQEIAKRAGISVGNFYNYFENKDAIIDEFAQREVARLAREIDEIVNGRVSLEEQRRQFRESLRKQLAVQRARVKIEGGQKQLHGRDRQTFGCPGSGVDQENAPQPVFSGSFR